MRGGRESDVVCRQVVIGWPRPTPIDSLAVYRSFSSAIRALCWSLEPRLATGGLSDIFTDFLEISRPPRAGCDV